MDTRSADVAYNSTPSNVWIDKTLYGEWKVLNCCNHMVAASNQLPFIGGVELEKKKEKEREPLNFACMHFLSCENGNNFFYVNHLFCCSFKVLNGVLDNSFMEGKSVSWISWNGVLFDSSLFVRLYTS